MRAFVLFNTCFTPFTILDYGHLHMLWRLNEHSRRSSAGGGLQQSRCSSPHHMAETKYGEYSSNPLKYILLLQKKR